jgi:hypothetical protein
VTGHYDSDPEVIDIEVDYEESMIEEDDVERPRSRHAQKRVESNVREVERVQPLTKMQRDVLVKKYKFVKRMREWSRSGLVRGGATACKAEMPMAAAVERAKQCYSEDDPEVIDIETDYEENNIELLLNNWAAGIDTDAKVIRGEIGRRCGTS